MKIYMPKPEHEVAYQDLCKLVSKHAELLLPIELLAVASNMLGKLVAMQDQRVTTPEHAMQVVAANIQAGNQQALAELLQSKGSA